MQRKQKRNQKVYGITKPCEVMFCQYCGCNQEILLAHEWADFIAIAEAILQLEEIGP